MLIYIVVMVILYPILLCTNWDTKYNKHNSYQFKLLFCLLSSVMWPIFLSTIIIDSLVLATETVFKFVKALFV